MARWDSLVGHELESRDLPQSLKFLPVIESGYSPTAVSHASAVGLWQFMAPTARGFGMEVTPLVDQRRDPWVATPWALQYLEDLRDRFGGSWHLALAGYNAGPWAVERVLARYAPDSEPSDSLYWALRSRLPRETRAFVPKFLAAAQVGSDPAAFGIQDLEGHAPLTFEMVEVPDATSTDVIARAAEVPQRMIETLNPQLVRGLTPAGVSVSLRVPAGQGETFQRNYAEIPPSERVTFVEHRVAAGETFTHIARRYGVRVSDVRAANPRISPRRLQIGQRVVVPTAPSAREALRSQQVALEEVSHGSSSPASTLTSGQGGSDVATSGSAATGATHTLVHEVEPGESLWVIARRYDVRVAQVLEWNRMEQGALIHPGDELLIRAAPPAEYVVRTGDTLSGIARRFGVVTSELARMNGLELDSVIRPGDRVRIPRVGS
jgi:membrane-bound lytic murein transglycosylase D